MEEVYKIKQEETRLQDISIILIDFRTRLLEVTEKVRGKLTWIEANEAFPEHFPQQTTQILRIELELIEFSSKSALRLTTGVENTLERCVDFFKRMCTMHNKVHTSLVARI